MADAVDKARDILGGFRRGKKKAEDATETVEGATEKVEDAKRTAGEVKDAARDPAGAAKDAAGNAVGAVKDRVEGAATGAVGDAKDKAADVIRDNVPGIPNVPKIPNPRDILNKGKGLFGGGDLTEKILDAAAGKTDLQHQPVVRSFVEKSLKALGYSSAAEGDHLLEDINGFLKAKDPNSPGIKSLSEFTPQHLAMIYSEAKSAGMLDKGNDGNVKAEWDAVGKMLGIGGKLRGLIGEADGPEVPGEDRTLAGGAGGASGTVYSAPVMKV